MNLEEANTLEERDVRETIPSLSPPDGSPPHKHGKQGWLWLIVLILAGVGIYYYFFRPHKNPNQAASGSTPPAGARSGRGGGMIPVIGAKATKGDIGVYFTGLGAVTPIYTVTMKSQIAGYLTQVLYKEGQIVHKGDVLAEIDPRPYQVMLELAQAGLARDQANLQNALVDVKRYQTLVPLKAIPEQQLATQEALVKQIQGTVQTDQAQIDNAKLDLQYCHITSPITGRVGLRLIDPGNYVTANDSTGLVVITQVQPISVIFTLPQDQLPITLAQMRRGARLKVEALGPEKTKIADGVLATVDNQIDPTTGTVKLRANFDNRDESLFPNQFVNARLLVEDKQGVTMIPTAAIQRNSLRTYVYLVKPNPPGKPGAQGTAVRPHSDSRGAANKPLEGTVTVQTITIGTTEGDNAEVTSGLNPGDVVVMTGVDKLQEKTPVSVQFAAAKTGREAGGR